MHLRLLNFYQASHDLTRKEIHEKMCELGVDAKKITGSIMPTWMVGVPDNTVAVFTGTFDQDISKTLIAASMRAIIKKLDATSYAFMSEAWATTSKDNPDMRPPSEIPPNKRDDMLMVQSIARDDTEMHITRWLNLSSKKLGERVDETIPRIDMVGRLYDLFNEETPIDNLKERAKQH